MRQTIAGAMTLAVMAGVALAAGAPSSASAQSDLDAGKSPARMFAQGCSACHRTPQEVSYATRDFLLEHYTTGPRQADAMAAYLQAIRSEPARPAKPRRTPTAEADTAEVASTGSIGAAAKGAAKPEPPPAAALPEIEE